jgi:hypothetical protein
MSVPFAAILGSLLLVSAPTNVPNERTECVQPSIYLPSYLLPSYLEWLTCPAPGGEPDSAMRRPVREGRRS